MKYITNCKIVLKDRVVEGKALAYDEKISGVVCPCCIPEGAEVIDAGGNYVAPGFIDLHIHGYLGEDVSDGKAEGIRKIAEGIAKNGVTGWLPSTMTVSVEEIAAAFEVISSLKEQSKSWNGAAILGVNAEGPYINPKKKGAQAEEHILKPSAEFFKKYADLIKITTLAPEMDEGYEALHTLKKETNILVSMGHTDADYEKAQEAIDNGIGHITHLFNAQTALQHRNPGVVGAALNNNVSVELICDTFHIHPALFSLVAKVKGDKLCLVTDCTRAGGMPDGEYDLGGQKFYLNGIKCTLADGTIAGSVLRMNDAVLNFKNNTSLAMHEVVNAASLNPATAIGVNDKKGSIEVGKDADLVIFDENIRICKTIIGGTVRYEA